MKARGPLRERFGAQLGGFQNAFAFHEAGAKSCWPPNKFPGRILNVHFGASLKTDRFLQPGFARAGQRQGRRGASARSLFTSLALSAARDRIVIEDVRSLCMRSPRAQMCADVYGLWTKERRLRVGRRWTTGRFCRGGMPGFLEQAISTSAKAALVRPGESPNTIRDNVPLLTDRQ
jgi:hypothetical protein